MEPASDVTSNYPSFICISHELLISSVLYPIIAPYYLHIIRKAFNASITASSFSFGHCGCLEFSVLGRLKFSASSNPHFLFTCAILRLLTFIPSKRHTVSTCIETLVRINIRARNLKSLLFYPRKSMTVSVSVVCANVFHFSY